MIKLTINSKPVEVQENTTILKAAQLLGIEIPTMCWLDGIKPSTSCMICVVEDKTSGKILPACSYKAMEGMNIETDNNEIHDLRKSALELLLSDHVGDCEAPCQKVCPANMNIPLMNRLIAKNEFEKALNIVKETIPLPAVLGYICPAPCEKACRRKDIDQPVQICLLKRFTGKNSHTETKQTVTIAKENNNKKAAIIGAGPMGLTVAYYLQLSGFNCVIFDKNHKPGGMMCYQIAESQMPAKVLESEIEIIKNTGVLIRNNQKIDNEKFYQLFNEFDVIILAIGYDANQKEIELPEKPDISLQNIQFYRIKDKPVFAPSAHLKPMKMAVRAVGIGRNIAFSVNTYFSTKNITEIQKKFNSTFQKLYTKEKIEYLKEAVNIDVRTESQNHLSGFTAEQAINEAKRCMHCDCRKLDNCKLRDFSDEYQAKQKTFQLDQRNEIKKVIYQNRVLYEQEKCIKCGICVQITKKIQDEAGLTFIGRGFNVKIGIPYTQSVETALKTTADECIKSCPTGALSNFQE